MKKLKQKQTRNISPVLDSMAKYGSIATQRREPTLEAVLNSQSQIRKNLPSIMPKIRRSIKNKLMSLPINEKFSPIRETSRLEHAAPSERYQAHFHDELEELNDDIQRFEKVVKSEKSEQPLYFHGNIYRKRIKKPEIQKLPDNTSPKQELQKSEEKPSEEIEKKNPEPIVINDHDQNSEIKRHKRKSAIFPQGMMTDIIEGKNDKDEAKTVIL